MCFVLDEVGWGRTWARGIDVSLEGLEKWVRVCSLYYLFV